ncbi:MAG: hypothetical protein Ta2F_16170 [Termitinemataceae bacterium]|nr:MAG: hypothetical protein Ta2F_16170 [Termitinemataceae bacterium]
MAEIINENFDAEYDTDDDSSVFIRKMKINDCTYIYIPVAVKPAKRFVG